MSDAELVMRILKILEKAVNDLQSIANQIRQNSVENQDAYKVTIKGKSNG